MPPQILRPYQADGLRAVLQAYREGARRVLMILPTAGGKTSIFATLAAQIVAGQRHALVLVHRRELAEQAAKRLREFDTDFGFILSGERPRPHAKMQIATVQTLIRRRAPKADLVVCDEAHLSTAVTWSTILQQYPEARILGVTATPWRLGGKPLARSYDECVVIARPRELCEQGFLAPYTGFSFLAPDLSDVKTTGGDYNEKQSAKAMSQSLIVDNIVEEWTKSARDLSTVVFAVTVEHSKALTQRFQAAGIQAEHLDGSTSLETRRAILRHVERGDTRVLCNVGVAIEGLDIPRLKCCVLARPTKSLARAIQMMGRVRRPWEGQTARIHDHAFVIGTHGLPDQDRDYALDAKPELPPSLTTCKRCLATYDPKLKECPACGRTPDVRITGERILATVSEAEQWLFDSGTPATEPPTKARSNKPTRLAWNSPGRVVEGEYRALQRHDPMDPYKRTSYLIVGEHRDYILPGTTQLDELMARALIGQRVRVTYLREDQQHGGKSKKQFELEIDDGRPGGA